MGSYVESFPGPGQGPADEKVMPIAVVGLGFRGPGDATDVESLYRMILEAREAWSPVPKSKWNNDAFYHPEANHNGTSNVQAGHYFTGDLSRFDAPFFNMTHAEAEALDPQQRLLLECCYEGLENAGIPLGKAAGSNTAVFVGSFCGDYTDVLLRDPDAMPLYQATSSGHSRAIISNRLSYFFDFRGPSATIDTACSASLVALHMACQSLRTGESEQAVVAGANVILSHEITIGMSRMRFLSPDGRCYAFDERANGYARGEGVGCVILKPLDSALRDGDPIRAIIRNTRVNQDGKTPGITFPNRQAQEELIRHVYEAAGLNPLETSYVECHGTGTPTGDPLEVGAIASVFCPGRSPEWPLIIGSVKTNIGHLEGASGVAGLIKLVLMLEGKIILPNRNFNMPNKRIPFNDWNLKIATAPEHWETEGGIRRASVNSFGYGGTNAHAIVDEAEGYLCRNGITALNGAVQKTKRCQLSGTMKSHSNGTPEAQRPSSRIFVLSGTNEASANDYIKRLTAFLENNQNNERGFEEDLAYTLSERRTKFPWKAVIPAKSVHDLLQSLKGDSLTLSKSITGNPLLGFVFTGQGAQWYAMGRELMSDDPVVNAIIVRAGAHIRTLGAKWDLKGELERSAEDTRVDQPLFSQPLCTAIQIALVELLASWNIAPASVTGHSSGEIAAAYAVGVLSLEDAMTVAYYRGLVSDKISHEGTLRGGMMAVGLSREQVLPYLRTLQRGRVVVACINSPSSITVSGDTSALEELQHILGDERIFARRLKVGVAYHSHHMALVGEEYRQLISCIQLHHSITEQKKVQFFSSVSGTAVNPATLGPDYWVSNLLGEVKFALSLHSLCLETVAPNSKKSRKRSLKSGVHVLVEIGPHPALAGPVRQILQNDPKLRRSGIEYCSALARKKDAVTTCQELASKLVLSGYQVDLRAVNKVDNNGRKPKVVTDLPSYAWDHSRSYWAESRISRAWRTQPHPRHDLLGLPDRTSNPLEPRWRNILRASELPWVKDHKVLSNIIFPAAGYLAMGVEIMRIQAQARSIQPIGYCLREVTIDQALVFPDASEEVEVIISLKPYIESVRSPSDIWNEFSIYSVTEQDRWTEHCRGLVSAREAATVPNEVTGDLHPVRLAYEERCSNFKSCCLRSIDIEQLYKHLRILGLDYGPTFANLMAVSVGSSQAQSSFKIPDTRSTMPNEFETPLLVHPATIDTVFQSLFPSMEAAMGTTLENPLLPVFVEDVFISAYITNCPGQELCVLTETQRKDFRQSMATITVAESGQSNNSHQPVLTINNLTCTSMQSDNEHYETIEARKPVYKTHWSPDVDFFTPADIDKLCQDIQLGESEADNISALEQAGIYYFEMTLADINPAEVSSMRPYHQLLWACMQSFVHASKQNTLHLPTHGWHELGAEDRQLFLSQIESTGGEARMLCNVGKNLSRILRQEVEPLQLMVEEDRLEDYYRDNTRFDRNYRQVARYLEALAHKNPAMSILEVGAGTGGATLPLLQALDRATHQAPCCSRYHFTDISSGFFDAARERLDAWSGFLDFSKLDIEHDPALQGYEPHSYDLVIAANVLHATRSMQATMANVRKLLKPTGKLVLIELTRERLTTSAIFGTLPGWWAGADEGRTQGPTQTEEKWDTLLRETGFSGLDAVTWDSTTEGVHQGSMMVSTATVPQQVRQEIPGILILVQSSAKYISLDMLREGFSSITNEVEFSTVGSEDPRGKICVVLDEVSHPFLSQPTPKQFEGVKRIATTAAGVLWVTRGGNYSVTTPAANFITGFARTIRSEYGGNPVGVLDLDGTNPLDASAAANTVVKIFRRLFLDHQGAAATQDLEMVEHGGQIMIPRLIEDTQATERLNSDLTGSSSELQPFNSPGRALMMEVGVPGLLDSVHFIDDLRVQRALPPDEVQVTVHAAGLNFKDVMMAMGQIHYETLGLEFSGTVTAVGSQVQKIVVGDRVCGCSFGTFANTIRGKASSIQKLPDDMPFEVAASLPIVFCTAYFAVYKIAMVVKHDTVLIHAASGGLGQALIELCQGIGAEIFATVGNKGKKEFLMSHFGIPEDHIFFSRNDSFAKNVMRMTHGKGVDVIMNSLAGDMLRLSWECIAPFGRFIELGARDYTINSRLEMAKFARNVSFSAVNLVSLIRDRPKSADAVWEAVMNLFRQKSIRPPSPIVPFGISEVEAALRTMQTGKHMGKLVIVLRPGERVKAVARPKSAALFRSDASYVLVGALGGLGRAIALRMVDSGARNLIILSRSGHRSLRAQETVALLEGKGATVMIFACDISVASQVTKVLQSAANMPPIRGLIQGAMVLQDSLLENLDLPSFSAVTEPKVQGTWNLHELLPKNLDFFLLLSSTSGVIGNASQAPYAASSTFLDAFAHYRRRLGLAASTVDLGVILGIGYVAENTELSQSLERQGFEGTTEKELLALITTAIDNNNNNNNNNDNDDNDDVSCQFVTGLGTWDENSPLVFQEPRFSHFRQMARKSIEFAAQAPNVSIRLRDRLRQVKTTDEAIQQVANGIVSKVSSLSMIPEQEIQLFRPLSDYGIDSLVAVEMRNWVFKEFEAQVTILELLANEPLQSFSKKVCTKSRVFDFDALVV